MTEQEKKIFRNFSYRKGECIICTKDISIQECECPEEAIIKEDQQIEEYIAEVCQQQDRERWEEAEEDTAQMDAEEAVAEEETDLEDENYDSDDSGKGEPERPPRQDWERSYPFRSIEQKKEIDLGYDSEDSGKFEDYGDSDSEDEIEPERLLYQEYRPKTYPFRSIK